MAALVSIAFKNTPFYADRACNHGEMAAHYWVRVKAYEAQGLLAPNEIYDIEWCRNHMVTEAQEAWHYAQMLNDEDVAAELERQAAKQRELDAWAI